MTTKRNWRIQAEHQRWRTALVNLLETGERQIDRLRAEELLQGLDANREQYKAGSQALKEVDLLQQDNAALVAEVARLKDELAETNATLTQANDWIETHKESAGIR